MSLLRWFYSWFSHADDQEKFARIARQYEVDQMKRGS